MRQFSCPACLKVVLLSRNFEGRKGFCPECGTEVRWAKPLRRRGYWDRFSGTQKTGLAILVAIGALLLFSLFKNIFFNQSRAYSDGEFRALVMGKTEAEVVAALGPPYVSDTEPQPSPQAGKRCVGYVYSETRNPAWHVAGRDGGVGVFFNATTGRAYHIEFFPSPQQQNGRFILIRW